MRIVLLQEYESIGLTIISDGWMDASKRGFSTYLIRKTFNAEK